MITLLSNSNKYNVVLDGYPISLFVSATSDTTNIKYTWSRNSVVFDNNAPTYVISSASDATVGTFTVTLSDSNSQVIAGPFVVESKVPYAGGLTSSPIGPNTPTNTLQVTDAKYIKGGLQCFDNLTDLQSTTYYTRLVYGQIVLVEYDKPAVNENTGLPQTRNRIDRYYKFQVSDPKTSVDTKKAAINTAKADSSTWILITPGTGSEAQAEARISSTGAVTAIDVIAQGQNYQTNTSTLAQYTSISSTVVAISSNSLTHTGTSFAAATPKFTVTGAISAIQINSGKQGSGYLVPPQVIIYSGKVQIYPPAKWDIGTDWIEMPFISNNLTVDGITTQIIDGKLVSIGDGATLPESVWTKTDPIKASVGGITTSTPTSTLTGLNAVELIEKALYPYQTVTMSISTNNNTTPVEVGSTVNISTVTLNITNTDNIASSTIELSAEKSNVFSHIGSINVSDIVDNSVTFTLPSNLSHTSTVHSGHMVLSATLLEKGPQGTNDVLVSTHRHWYWNYNWYTLRDTASSLQGTLSIDSNYNYEVNRDRGSGSYTMQAVTEPKYMYILVPQAWTQPQNIGDEQGIPFYKSGGSYVTSTVTINAGSIPVTYLAYRSFNQTASNTTITAS